MLCEQNVSWCLPSVISAEGRGDLLHAGDVFGAVARRSAGPCPRLVFFGCFNPETFGSTTIWLKRDYPGREIARRERPLCHVSRSSKFSILVTEAKNKAVSLPDFDIVAIAKSAPAHQGAGRPVAPVQKERETSSSRLRVSQSKTNPLISNGSYKRVSHGKPLISAGLS